MTRIKLFVMDVDGTLTDGKLYISGQGEVFKAFNSRDGYGIKNILRDYGIKTAIITGRSTEIVKWRARELEIDYLFQEVRDKYACLEKLLKETGIDWNETAYAGDDINDLECIENVGWSGCPKDAHEKVRKAVDYVSKCEAGHGAVRDMIDMMLEGDVHE